MSWKLVTGIVALVAIVLERLGARKKMTESATYAQVERFASLAFKAVSMGLSYTESDRFDVFRQFMPKFKALAKAAGLSLNAKGTTRAEDMFDLLFTSWVHTQVDNDMVKLARSRDEIGAILAGVDGPDPRNWPRTKELVAEMDRERAGPN